MSIRIFLPVMAAVFAGCIGAAAQQNAKLRMEVGRTPANDGRQMYVSYCASCHGMDGKGSGEMAAVLKTQPADLTRLSSRNHGKYPAHRVATVLQEGVVTPAHGEALMPAWGPVFAKMDRSSSLVATSSTKMLRVSNLSRHIRGMQAD
jgi:cytochrome c553